VRVNEGAVPHERVIDLSYTAAHNSASSERQCGSRMESIAANASVNTVAQLSAKQTAGISAPAPAVPGTCSWPHGKQRHQRVSALGAFESHRSRKLSGTHAHRAGSRQAAQDIQQDDWYAAYRPVCQPERSTEQRGFLEGKARLQAMVNLRDAHRNHHSVVIVALIHVYILVLEMFLWEKPTGACIRLSKDFATATRVLPKSGFI